MRKIQEYNMGDFKGRIYEIQGGYGFRVYLNGKIVARNFVTFIYKDRCFNKMLEEIKLISGFDKTLFDLIDMKKSLEKL